MMKILEFLGERYFGFTVGGITIEMTIGYWLIVIGVIGAVIAALLEN